MPEGFSGVRDPALCRGSADPVTELQKSLRDFERRIAEAEHNWLKAQTASQAD